MLYRKRTAGVTLIELVMVIAIMGLMAGTALIFMQRTFVGYSQARERLLVAEQGRLTLNRVKRDLRLSLPNSVRLSSVGGVYYLEFAPVVVGGRYRAASATGADIAPLCPVESTPTADGSVLTMGVADSCFKTLGVVDMSSALAGNWVVIFNSGPGYTGSDFYENGAVSGGNKAQLASFSSSATETKINFTTTTFTWDSPGHRFYVVQNPVSYVCDPVSNTLTRWGGYAVQAAQPTLGLSGLSGASSAILSKNVSTCQITYAPASIANQYGLVTINMKLSTAGGSLLSLQAQAQIANMP